MNQLRLNFSVTQRPLWALSAAVAQAVSGSFNANWSASAFLAGGTVDLITPNVIRVANCELHYNLQFTFSFDLSNIIPDFSFAAGLH